MLELYSNIKKLRVEHRMSQDELARLAGYTDRSSIAKIEQGSVDLPQSKISMFAKIFRVTPSFLMGDDGVIRPDPDLRPDEVALLSIYNTLNNAGREKTRDYILDLCENERYKKDGGSSSDSETA